MKASNVVLGPFLTHGRFSVKVSFPLILILCLSVCLSQKREKLWII